MNEPTLRGTLEVCRDFKFNADLTHEVVWNTAYRLGRARWHWGPSWMPSVIGWLNTRLGLVKALIANGILGFRLIKR